MLSIHLTKYLKTANESNKLTLFVCKSIVCEQKNPEFNHVFASLRSP